MKLKNLVISFIILLIIPINIFATNKAVVDITKMDITELSQALDAGLLTSEELVNLYLDRINTYDSKLNSIITINESAINDARRLDQERKDGNVRSIMHGIPIVVKDNIDVYGMPTTAGARALINNMPTQNAHVVQKLIDAGAIVIAKTNMSEFGFQANSSISTFGRVNNAFNILYTPYGSSGGTAVAVASSFAAAGLGTDTNSSLRSPAAANNIVGLRPTIGLISRTGVLPYDIRRDVVGPMTRNVQDSIIIMNIINGYDSRDELSTNQTKQTFEIKRENLDGITIGVPEDFIRGSNGNQLRQNQRTDGRITSAMEESLRNLEAAGAKIVFIKNYWTNDTSYWYNSSLSGFTMCDGVNRYLSNTTGPIRTFQQLANTPGRTMYLTTARCNAGNNFTTQNNLKASYRKFMEELMTRYNVDVIAYPSNKNILLRHDNLEDFRTLTFHASSTINYPSIALPLGFDPDGLPFGIEFMTPTGKEQLLFEVAMIHEQVNGNDIMPQISPALYDIDDEVETLVENYLYQIDRDVDIYFWNEWQDDVLEFFREYSEYEDVVSRSKELNERYEENVLREEKMNKTTFVDVGKFLLRWILIIVGIIIGLFILLIILAKIVRYRRRQKKRKRKNLK